MSVTQVQVNQLYDSNTQTINDANATVIAVVAKMLGGNHTTMTANELNSMTNIIHSKIDQDHGITIITFANNKVITINY